MPSSTTILHSSFITQALISNGGISTSIHSFPSTPTHSFIPLSSPSLTLSHFNSILSPSESFYSSSSFYSFSLFTTTVAQSSFSSLSYLSSLSSSNTFSPSLSPPLSSSLSSPLLSQSEHYSSSLSLHSQSTPSLSVNNNSLIASVTGGIIAVILTVTIIAICTILLLVYIFKLRHKKFEFTKTIPSNGHSVQPVKDPSTKRHNDEFVIENTNIMEPVIKTNPSYGISTVPRDCVINPSYSTTIQRDTAIDNESPYTYVECSRDRPPNTVTTSYEYVHIKPVKNPMYEDNNIAIENDYTTVTEL